VVSEGCEDGRQASSLIFTGGGHRRLREGSEVGRMEAVGCGQIRQQHADQAPRSRQGEAARGRTHEGSGKH
jgi:hypothetical protein